jgi:Ran GTPase-activating protein 1
MGALFSAEQATPYTEFEIPEEGKHFNSGEDVEQGCKYLDEHAATLTQLTLSKNSYGVEACRVIGTFLQKCHNIEVANFSDMFTSRLRSEVPQSLLYLTEGLLVSKSLRVLDLSDNAFGPDGVRGFSALLENCASLKELKINNNGLGPEGGRMVAEALLKCDGMKLEVFQAGRNRLENPGAKALAEVFLRMGSLRMIALYQNGIRAEGMLPLVESFAGNSELQMIEINDNYLNDPVVYETLARSLATLNYVSVLNIGDSLLGNQGALAIIQALRVSSPHLLNLNLQYNELDSPKIFEELTELVQDRKELEFLSLKGNEFKKSLKVRFSKLMEDIERSEVLAPYVSEGEEEEDEEDEEDEEEEEVEVVKKAMEKLELKEE